MKYPAKEADYRSWRALRLDRRPSSLNELSVSISGLASMANREKEQIMECLARANMALYDCRDSTVDRAAILTFAGHFGLRQVDHHLCANDDGVAELTVATTGERAGYVPYSSRSLSWHTDGYYNEPTKKVRAVILHCAQDAVTGGQNAVFDPEIAYIRLRDENPAFVAAFAHPHCMTIPANNGADGEIRPAVSGPVFSFDGPGGALHMRFSARTRNIRWRDDAMTRAARDYLLALLDDDESVVFRFSLKPGQGLISNNVLHNRTAFQDASEKPRFLYRARFFDRVDSSSSHKESL